MNINNLQKLNLHAVEEALGYSPAELLGHGKKMELFFCRLWVIHQLRSNSLRITYIAKRMNRTKSGIIYALKHYHVCKKHSKKFRETEQLLLINQKKRIKKWRISKLKARRALIYGRAK